MRSGEKFGIHKGQWTDDTSIALCLANSLLESDWFSPSDQMNRYFQWLDTGYLSSKEYAFGIGKTIFQALLKYRTTKDAYCGSKAATSAGNGALMRLAPIAMFFFPNKHKIEYYSAESAKTTHGAIECLQANSLFGRMLCSAFDGYSKQEILFNHNEDKDWSPGIRAIAKGEYLKRTEVEISSSGYVVDSLEAALWCFTSTDSFEQALLKSVNLGGDADTVGAICGQIAGAFSGVPGLPTAWLEGLYLRDEIQSISHRLCTNLGL